jgi:hypothetical protein
MFYKPGRIVVGGYWNGSGGEQSECEVAEVLIFSNVLSGAELDAVSFHLQQKYGLSTDYSPPGQSYAWVQVPEISSSNDYIWATWGGTNAAVQQTYTTNGATWSNGFAAVYHLADIDTVKDSSTNRQHATAVGMQDYNLLDTRIGRGMTFDGNVGNYTILNPVSEFPGTEITASFWARCAPQAQGVVSYAVSAQNDEFLLLQQANPFRVLIRGVETAPAFAFGDETWHRVTVTWRDSDDALKVYLDGARRTTRGPLRRAVRSCWGRTRTVLAAGSSSGNRISVFSTKCAFAPSCGIRTGYAPRG